MNKDDDDDHGVGGDGYNEDGVGKDEDVVI